MVDLREQSPLALAFLGDAVYSLVIREKIVSEKRLPLAKLNLMCIDYVSAKGQFAALKLIGDLLTPEEITWVKRGRNATKTSVPKHSDPEEYRASTGFECLFGYLRLTGQEDRIKYLTGYIFENTKI